MTQADRASKMSNHIQPLPPEVVAQIRSSAAITSLNDVVRDLLCNALDAQSTKIEIEVDFGRGSCIIQDDGHGIQPLEFEPDGGLGVIYCTSRIVEDQVATFGRYGAFLALLGDISLLTITSQHRSHPSQNTLTIHQGKVISRLIPTPAGQSIDSRNHGTHVSVQNLFGNLPVRVKQRGLKGEDQNAWYHEWEKLKLDLVSLLLGWPFPVRVSLLDPRGNKKRVLCRKGHVGGRVVVEDDKIDQLDITQVRVLLKDAGYIQPLSWDSWQSLSASTSGITVRSAVTLDPVPTKQVQFISLGILPLRAGSRASLLYETINTVFAQSHFGLEEDEIPRDEAKQGQRTSNQRFKDSPTSKQFKRSRRAVDRWPMFFVQILINKQDRGSYHTSIEGLEKEETLTAISNILRAMFKAFLEQHYLQPRREISKLQRLDSMKATAVGDHSQSKLSTPISKQLPHRGPQSSRLLATRPVKYAGDTGDTGESGESGESAQNNTSKDLLPSTASMASKTTNGRPRSSTTYSLQGSSNTLSIWSRIKSGRSEFFEKDYHHTRRKETSSVEICGYPSADREQRPQVSEDRGDRVKSATPKDDQPGSTALLDQDAQNCSEDTINSIELVDSTYCNSNTSYDEDDSYTWQDPVSKEIIRINSRTGQALLQVPFQSEPKTVLGSCTTDSLREQLKSNFRLKKSTNVEIKTGQSIQSLNWVDMFLEEWDNPVFAPTEQPISQASKFSSLGEDSTKDLVNCCSHSSIDELSSSTSATRLSKLSMKTAEVISQLDRKFILVKMNQEIGPPSISSLVLVDQHAADERCRVEDLLSALCEPVMSSTSCQSNSTCPIQTFPFDKPLNLQITCQEAKLFEIYAQHFKTWGIIYDLNNELSNFKGKKSKQDIRLVVRSVPPGIVERCKTEPKRLLELLRAEIWKSHDHSGQSRFTSKTDLGGKGGLSTHSWLERIGSCPQGILDMLISRSCRSAIMFNDELTIDQCTTLVHRLGDCAFPFQCAHGRPSVIPLVDLGGISSILSNSQIAIAKRASTNGKSDNDFTTAFRAWKE